MSGPWWSRTNMLHTHVPLCSDGNPITLNRTDRARRRSCSRRPLDQLWPSVLHGTLVSPLANCHQIKPADQPLRSVKLLLEGNVSLVSREKNILHKTCYRQVYKRSYNQYYFFNRPLYSPSSIIRKTLTKRLALPLKLNSLWTFIASSQTFISVRCPDGEARSWN